MRYRVLAFCLHPQANTSTGTSSILADMRLCLGFAGTLEGARNRYRELYSNRVSPNARTFGAVDRAIREENLGRNIHDRPQKRPARNPALEQDVIVFVCLQQTHVYACAYWR